MIMQTPTSKRLGAVRSGATALLLAISVSACAVGPYDTDELAGMAPPNSQFLQSLSNEYVALGDLERTEYDWPDTAKFFDRAIRAGKGEMVEPEMMDQRDLDPAARQELKQARDKLTALFSAGARSVAGSSSASAQGGFDCWMQELEEGHQPDDIAKCREMFLAALSDVEATVKGALVVLLPEDDGKLGVIRVENQQGSITLDTSRASALVARTDTAPKSTGTFAEDDVRVVFGAAIAAGPTPPVTFMLYFEQGTDTLTPESLILLDKVLETIRQRKLPQVEVSGHTDRSGSANFNDRLALDRASIVGQEVLNLGVPEEVITVESYGERAPIVPTADGVSEPRNRRVEIVIR
ncbi:OmpA family protein [Nisaea nitritireducens]|uniref:OmpA family protein n=1 Tax=Nisaea nitritireducens TaxID=568392 RepID=UPI001865C648|nr:OmpA family protein [Nisaea nitritireducens]